MRRRSIGIVAISVAIVAAGAATAPSAQADSGAPIAPWITSSETTIGYSNARQNWDLGEPALTTVGLAQQTAAGTAAFGQLWDKAIPGTTGTTPNQVYAQPIVADGHVIVATDDNEIASYDPVTGAEQWARSLGPAWTSPAGCGDLTPHIGITATPVYNPRNRTLYLIDKTAIGSGAPSMQVHAIDAVTGLDRPGWPLTITGRATNGGPAFSATTSASRAGLLLGDDGDVYFGLASHCDLGPFVGYVGHVITSGRPSVKLWATVTNNDNGQAGIWQSGGGLMSDGSDAYGHPNLFVATGNGIESAPKPGPGTAGSPQLSESVIRLTVDQSTGATNGNLQAADFFSPSNGEQLDLNDTDLGSSSPVALSTGWGSATHPDLLVVAGKDGTVRLLDRDALGGKDQGPGGTDAVVSSTPGSGVWGHAAVFDTGQGQHFVYLTPAGSPLAAYRVTADANGTPTLTQVAASTTSFPFGSGSPVVTSDPADRSTALVWVVSNTAGAGTLVAYPAIPPTTGPWAPVAQFPLGHLATKFSQPATVNGRLYLGTRDGHLLAFGASTAAPVTGSDTDFGSTPVATPVTRTASFTTGSGIQVVSVATSAPFTAGNLTAGSTTASVPVTFTPTVAGGASGSVIVTTSDGATTSFGLHGTGTATGFSAAPNPIDLGTVAAGQSSSRGVLLTNTGASAATITNATISGTGSQYFTISSAVPHNSAVAAGAGVAVTITFAPTDQVTTSVSYHPNLVLTTSAGQVSIPITGTTHVGTAVLSLSAPSLDLGQVQPGSSAVGSFKVQNNGNAGADAALVITKAGQPGPPFYASIPIAEDTTIQPSTSGYDGVYAQITVKPLNALPATDQYFINARPAVDGDTLVGAPQTFHMSVNTQPWVGRIGSPAGCIAAAGTPSAGSSLTASACGSSSVSFARSSDGRLHLGSATGPLCLSVVGASTKVGAQVRAGTCSTATAGQVWTVPAAGTLIDAHSGRCLHVAGAGKPLDLAACTTSSAEQWDVTALYATRGLVSSALAPLGAFCLGDKDSSTSFGSYIETRACSFAGGQIITSVAGTLRTEGGCLTVRAPSNKSGVLLEQCTGAKSQQWTTGTTGHQLYNPGSKLCLVAPSTVDGTRPYVTTCTGSPNEQWALPTS